MEWGTNIPLKDVTLIDKFEQQVGYHFPTDYRQCAIEHGNAWVQPDTFDTQKHKGRAFNRLFSFNTGGHGSIWILGVSHDEEEAALLRDYVPFANSPCGDLICFDKRNDSVVYIDHETLAVEYVAPSFQAFLDGLYEEED